MQSTSGGLTARAKELLGYLSVREQKLWFELVLDVAVGLYFYPKAFALMVAGDAALTGNAMTALIVGTVAWAITLVILGTVLSTIFKLDQKPEPKDERDFLIENTTGRWFGRILVICLLGIIGMIVLQAMAFDAGSMLFTLTPLGIAVLLLFSLMLASLVDSMAKLYGYRRGF